MLAWVGGWGSACTHACMPACMHHPLFDGTALLTLVLGVQQAKQAHRCRMHDVASILAVMSAEWDDLLHRTGTPHTSPGIQYGQNPA